MRCSPRLLVALLFALGLVVVGPARPTQAQTADDDLSDKQWALTQVHAPTAWAVSTGKDVKIGIVDSGVNRNHEDLANKVLAAATCVSTDGNPAKCTSGGDDIHGHGTHVSGLAAANTGNGPGIAGVAPDAKLIMARVFAENPDDPENPTAEVEDVVAGIEWVRSQGAQIINLSLGVGGVCVTCGTDLGGLAPAINKAYDEGALPIVAAGNRGGLLDPTPDFDDIKAIVVAGTDRNDEVSTLSLTTGTAQWGIAAPGGGFAPRTDPRCTDSSSSDCPMILSTFAGETCGGAANCYAYLSGSSMAAPHVSGAAALLFAKGLSRDQVRDTLLATTDTIDCGENCAGRLNVARALSTVASGATNEPKGNGGGNGNTATTRKPSSSGTPSKSNATTSTPTTSPFTFGNETTRTSTTQRRPSGQAIVLNTQPDRDDGIPVGVGFLGIMSLAGAALAMSYNLRRTLTTLP